MAASRETHPAELNREGPVHAKQAAAFAVGRIGGAEGERVLTEALGRETDEEVKRAIRTAIGSLNR